MKEKALRLIHLCVLDVGVYHIFDLKTLNEASDKLESQYRSKTWKNKLFKKQRVYSLKMQEGFHLQKYVNVFNTIIINPVRLSLTINDEGKVIILLCSLPSSYDHLVPKLTYVKDTTSLDVITDTLLSHSQR